MQLIFNLIMNFKKIPNRDLTDLIQHIKLLMCYAEVLEQNIHRSNIKLKFNAYVGIRFRIRIK